MEFIAPLPYDEAVQKLGDQSVVGSTFTSSEWSDLPVELRDNAFFSSRVESARVLQRAKDLLADYLAGNTVMADNGQPMLSAGSRAAFVAQMQDFLAKEGAVRTTGNITDITSEKRLGLIFDVKTRQAQDFGYWKQGMDPDVLSEFPAARFIRVRDVKEPRELHERFQDQAYLKTDPIWWLEINKDFGVPWGPWGWGCGHDVEDVDRDEAESLHLLKPGQHLAAGPLKKFLNLNYNLQAGVKTMDPDLVDKLLKEFGDRIVLEKEAGILRWLGRPSAQPGDEVTPEDRAALADYTRTANLKINRALWRDGADAPVSVWQSADALSTALAKLPDYTGEVYRGLRRTPEQLLAAARRYLPGNVVTEDGYVSSTADRGTAFPGELRFEIVSKTGKLLGDYSATAGEQEVLFDQGTQFKVTGAQMHGGALHVRLEEL